MHIHNYVGVVIIVNTNFVNLGFINFFMVFIFAINDSGSQISAISCVSSIAKAE